MNGRVPVGPRGEAMQRRLLEAAIDHFGTAGFREASVSQIARACGVTQAAAYRYYANKQDLFDAAVLHVVAEALDEADDGHDGGSMADWVARYLLRFEDAIAQRPLAVRVLANQEGDTLHRLIDSEAALRIEATMLRQLRAGQEAGTVRRDLEADVVARGLEKLFLAMVVANCCAGIDPRSGSVEGLMAIARATLLPVPADVIAD